MQLYQIGDGLRQKYGGILLNDHYLENEIYIQSSDEDRTIQSAYCLLAGLYPPRDEQIWNDDLLWQPIPVHTINIFDDNLIYGILLNCPLYDMYREQLWSHPDFIKMYETNKSFYDYLAKHAGLPPVDITSAFVYAVLIRDILLIQNLYLKP